MARVFTVSKDAKIQHDLERTEGKRAVRAAIRFAAGLQLYEAGLHPGDTGDEQIDRFFRVGGSRHMALTEVLNPAETVDIVIWYKQAPDVDMEISFKRSSYEGAHMSLQFNPRGEATSIDISGWKNRAA